MDRVQVELAKSVAATRSRRSLWFMRSEQRRLHVITFCGFAFSEPDPKSFGSGSPKFGSDASAAT